MFGPELLSALVIGALEVQGSGKDIVATEGRMGGGNMVDMGIPIPGIGLTNQFMFIIGDGRIPTSKTL